MEILVTGARAPVALEWVRFWGRLGHRVSCCDTLGYPLAASSRYCAKYHRFPSPRQNYERFKEWCAGLPSFDLVIPTCEEIFWLAQADVAGLYSADFELLRRCHHKGDFNALCHQLGLGAPRSFLYTEPLTEPDRYVLKPVYSRWAHRCLRPPHHELPSPDPSWLVQEHCLGTEFSTFALAHRGQLTAFIAYPRSTQAFGASVVFEPREDPRLRTWVERFLKETSFHGQVAFDFIVTDEGPMALECNPRCTSGLHLLAQNPGLEAAVLAGRPLGRVDYSSRQLFLAALVYARTWARGAADVLFAPDDPWPAVAQFFCLGELTYRARRGGGGIAEASTFGIAYDG